MRGGLRGCPGVIAPATVTLAARAADLRRCRDALWRATASNFRCCCARRVFTPAAILFCVDRAAALAEAVAGLPGAELTAIQYLDSRGADGKVRKYRVMMIDGRLYPLHLAISSHWKIHYFTAEMADRSEHRAEDAEFLENMPARPGPARDGRAGTDPKRARIGLCGHRFRLESAGDLLLFEANATMVVNPPEPDERWAYRRPAVERIFAASAACCWQRAAVLNISDNQSVSLPVQSSLPPMFAGLETLWPTRRSW